MVKGKLFCGVLTVLLLFTVIVIPSAAGGKKEKSEEESQTRSEQKSEDSTQQETAVEGASGSSGDGPEPAAVVDGEEITMDRFNQFLQMQQMQYMQQGQQVQGAQLEELKKRVLEYLIDQEVLYQTAVDEGYSAEEENVSRQIEQYKSQSGGEEQFEKALAQQGMTVEDLRKDVRKQLVIRKLIEEKFEANVSVSDSEAKEFYDVNPEYFTQQEQVQVQHIIVQVEQDAAQEKVEEARSKIEKVQKELNEGADFGELAREYSEGPSSENGGSLGYIQKGQMVPEFEETAFSLEPGEVSDIIRTQFGFHLVKVTDRKEEEISPYAEVKSDIVNHLKSVKMDQEVQSFLEEKKKDMDIKRYAVSG